MAIDFFGAGVLFATPTFDASGTAIAVPSPVQFGIVQDVTIDDTADIKELYGANQYPVDIGRGKAKLMIKCKQAQFSAELFNTIYYGQTLTAAYHAILADSVGTAVPTGAGTGSPPAGESGRECLLNERVELPLSEALEFRPGPGIAELDQSSGGLGPDDRYWIGEPRQNGVCRARITYLRESHKCQDAYVGERVAEPLHEHWNGLRRLQGPRKLRSVILGRLALVDLHAGGASRERENLTGRRPQAIGNLVAAGLGNGMGRHHRAEQRRGCH